MTFHLQDLAADLVGQAVVEVGYVPQDAAMVLMIDDVADVPCGQLVRLPGDTDAARTSAGTVVALRRDYGGDLTVPVAVVAFGDRAAGVRLWEAFTALLPDSCGVLLVVFDGQRVWWPGSHGQAMDLWDNRMIAQAAWGGRRVLRTRSQVVAEHLPDPDPPLEHKQAMVAALEALVAMDPEQAQAEGTALLAAVTAWLAGDRDELPWERLAAAAHCVPARQVLWLAISQVTAAEHGELWRQVAIRTWADVAAPAVALTGFCHWLQGHGALANVTIDLTLDIQPDLRDSPVVAGCLLGTNPNVWEQIRTTASR